jgi:hypothetical protein
MKALGDFKDRCWIQIFFAFGRAIKILVQALVEEDLTPYGGNRQVPVLEHLSLPDSRILKILVHT